jgi:hypothetical protein
VAAAARAIRQAWRTGDMAVPVIILRSYPPEQREAILELLSVSTGGGWPRGQALVEAAVVMPLLLFVVMAGVALAIILFDRQSVAHAAQEGAIMGAQSSGDRCADALDAYRAVLGRSVASESCSDDNTLVELDLTDQVPLPVPFLDRGTWPVRVIERGAIRATPAPSPSPSP